MVPEAHKEIVSQNTIHSQMGFGRGSSLLPMETSPVELRSGIEAEDLRERWKWDILTFLEC